MRDFKLWQYTWEDLKIKNQRPLATRDCSHVLQSNSSLGNCGKKKVKSLRAEDKVEVTAEKWTPSGSTNKFLSSLRE